MRKNVTVKDVAAALGYQLRTAKRETASALTFAIVAHDLLSRQSIWTQQMFYSVFNTLSHYGHQTVLEFLPSGSDAVLASARGAADCMVWSEFPDRFYANLAKATGGMPVVSYSRTAPYDNSVAVMVDNQRSMSQTVGYLLASKHCDIAYMTWARKFELSAERQTGFRATMAEFGQRVDEERVYQLYERPPDWEADHPGSVMGYEATRELLKLTPCPASLEYGSRENWCSLREQYRFRIIRFNRLSRNHKERSRSMFGTTGGYFWLDSWILANIAQLGTQKFCGLFLNRSNDPCERQYD